MLPMMQTITHAQPANHQEVRITSSQESVLLVEKLLQELSAPYYVNEDVYGNMLVALTEAITNAIQHGNKFDMAKHVSIKCDAINDGIRFTVSDEGPGFDYDQVPDPTSPENIEKPNGRGVFLMRHLADGVEFEEKGRIVMLDFKLHQTAAE
jgi:serine/threonine-protein kinase RsbW